MSRAGQKGGTSVFILFSPKCTKIKDPDKIKKRKAGAISFISVNAQLSNSNRPKTSPLNQIVNTKNSLSDLESITGSKAGFNT